MKNEQLRVVIFGMFNKLNAESEEIWDLMHDLRELKFFPTTFNEINASNNNFQANTRPGFESRHLNIRIDFNSDAISIYKIFNQTMEEKFEIVLNHIKFIIDKILSRINQNASRISIISSTNIDVASKINKIYKKIFNPIEFYNHDNLIEWNSRSVARVIFKSEQINEDVNIVTEISKPFSGLKENEILLDSKIIKVSLDINTVPENTNFRINYELAKDFIEIANDHRNTILEQIGGMVDAL